MGESATTVTGDGGERKMDAFIKHVAALYSPTATDAERKAAELTLENLRGSDDAMVLAMTLLAGGTKADGSVPLQATFFALSMLEEMARETRWDALPAQERETVRLAVLNFSLGVAGMGPSGRMVAEKAAMVLVLMARKDWPALWPRFIDDAMELARQGSSFALLRCVCDGTLTNWTHRDSLSRARRVEIERMLKAEDGKITLVLAQLLSEPKVINSPPALEQLLHTLLPFLERVSLEHAALETIARAIFAIAFQTRSPLAVACLTQILERKYVPPGPRAEDFVLHAANSALGLMAPPAPSPSDGATPRNTPEFESNLVQLVGAFIRSHFRRAEALTPARFSVEAFLSAYFNFTFNLGEAKAFVLSLDVWSAFVDHVNEMEVAFVAGTTADANDHRALYATCLRELVLRLLMRFMYKKTPNPDALRSLEASFDLAEDLDELDDGDENENAAGFSRRASPEPDGGGGGGASNDSSPTDDDLSFVVARIVGLIAKIALLPVSFENVGPVFATALEGLRWLRPALEQNSLAAENTRDATTDLQVVAAVAPLFGRNPSAPEATELVTWAVEALEACLTRRAWATSGTGNRRMMVQSINTLSSFSTWFDVVASTPGGPQQQLVVRVADAAFGVFVAASTAGPVPEDTTLAAARLVGALPSSVVFARPAASAALERGVSSALGMQTLPSSVRDALCVVFARGAFRAGGNNPTALRETLGRLFAADVANLQACVGELVRVGSASGHSLAAQARAKLRAVASLVKTSTSIPETAFRAAMYDVLRPAIESDAGVLALVAVCTGGLAQASAHAYAVREALDFLALTLRGFAKQMGEAGCVFVARAVVDTFARDRRAAELLHSLSNNAVPVLSRVLGVLESLLEQEVSRAALPDVLKLVLGDIWMPAQQGGWDAVLADASRVSLHALDKHWAWFAVRSGGAAGAAPSSGGVNARVLRPEAEQLWRGIWSMVVVDRLTLATNMDDVRFLVAQLLELHGHTKVFEFDAFRAEFRFPVTMRVLDLLRSRERELLVEELAELAWALNSFDGEGFFTQAGISPPQRMLFVVGGGLAQPSQPQALRVDKASFKAGLLAWCE